MFNPNVNVQIVLNQLSDSGQEHKVLAHLVHRGNISQLEARNTYRVERLTSRVTELKKRGVAIKSEMRLDESGHKYARYYLVNG